MQLHSFLQEHPNATKLELDNILDGNICRCTGYRPILDALKQFASDADPASKIDHLIEDIEDIKLCKRTGDRCLGKCAHAATCKDGTTAWHQPQTVEELTQILSGFTADTKYRIVGGNTGTGVFKHDEENYDALVNINKISDLKAEETNPMSLGGNVSITDAIHFFERVGQSEPMWNAISRHLSWIASVGIRNQGTLAGNLMMKNAHNDFPSDVYISMATVGAMLEVVDHTGASEQLSVVEFMTTDMHRKFIKTIHFSSARHPKNGIPKKLNVGFNRTMRFPAEFIANGGHKVGTSRTFIRTFKIMPRSSNAHAYVNAGFMAEIDPENNYQIVSKPTVVFGGINPTFTHATETENFLMNKNMNDHDMFQQALQTLESELEPEYDPVLAAPEYRKQLALGLFYKVQINTAVHKNTQKSDKNFCLHIVYGYFIINICSININPFFSSSCMCWDHLLQLKYKVELNTLTEACPRVNKAMTQMRPSILFLNLLKRLRASGRLLEKLSTLETSP